MRKVSFLIIWAALSSWSWNCASAQEVPPSTPVEISRQEWHSVLERLERAETELDEVRRLPELETLPAPAKEPPPVYPKVRLSGFFHADAGTFDQDAESIATLGDIQNGVGFRRARLQGVGSVTEFTNFSIEMDFGFPGRPSFMDVWLEQIKLPLFGTVRVGQFRQPISMDSWTPIRQLMFLERSLPFQAFDPFRRVGVMGFDHAADERTTWQYSLYRTGGFDNNPLGDSRFGNDIGDGGGLSVATRATHLLAYENDGEYLLHIGGNAAFSTNTVNDHNPSTPYYQSRALPEFFVGDFGGGGLVAAGTPFFVDTGRLPANTFQIYGAELGWQSGPWHFQSEYLCTVVDQLDGQQLFYDGAYAQAGVFLTGEHRTYYHNVGVFDRVVPYQNFFGDGGGLCGLGAWELAGRISYVNLNDPNATPLPGFVSRPGRLTDSTLGLNWYWNAYTKLQFNWIHSWLDNATIGKSDTDIFAMRAQLEF